MFRPSASQTSPATTHHLQRFFEHWNREVQKGSFDVEALSNDLRVVQNLLNQTSPLNSPATDGLFPKSPLGGSLFGSSPASGGSLFGGPSTHSGLFGAALHSSGGLFGNVPPTSTPTPFLATSYAPQTDTDGVIVAISGDPRWSAQSFEEIRMVQQ